MKKQFFALIMLLLTSVPAIAGWMANADFSSCPRQYIPSTSGSEGPFGSESECLARIDQVKSSQNLSCASYSCAEEGSSGSAAAPAAGHELDKNIGDAISAGIQGNISPTDAAGLVSMGLLGNAFLTPTPAAPQKTSVELEADRVAAEKRATEYARIEQERQFKKDQRVAPIFALLDPIPQLPSQNSSDKPAKSDYYTKAYEHASQCISRNAGPTCAGVTAEQQSKCVADYNAGYEAGAKERELNLTEAYQAGVGAAVRGEKQNAFADERAKGPCRIEWLDSYDKGYSKTINEKKGH